MSEDKYSPGMWLQSALFGGIVTTTEMAIDVAAAILKGHYGDEGLREQEPLEAFDEGDAWLVEGAYTENG